MTQPNDLPPVGATLEVDGETYHVARHADWGTPVAIWAAVGSQIGSGDHLRTLTALWRAEQQVAELEVEIDQKHETDETLLAALITATLCRLPAEIVGDDWWLHREEHNRGWMGQHRAFGGWLSGRITVVLNEHKARIAELEAEAAADRASIDVLSDEVHELRAQLRLVRGEPAP